MTTIQAAAIRQPLTTRRSISLHALRPIAAAGLALGLSGCGSLLNTWTDNSGNLVAAEPLCEDRPGMAYGGDGTCKPVCATPVAAQPGTAAGVPVAECVTVDSTPDGTKPYLSAVIKESEAKCDRFVAGLVLAANTSNTGLDVLTTLFTALGSAFSPLGTVHALTAAGSVSSGSKTAIDADIYGKMTIANYAQVIKTGYYGGISNYMTDLDASTLANLDRGEEEAKIHSYHAQCSLASAQAALNATSSAPATAPSTQSTGGGAVATPPAPAAPAPAAPAAAPATNNPSGVFTRSTVPGHALR